MSTRLRIKRFKGIYDETVFEEFDFVNYFVGETGSGKTSVLNAVSFLNDGVNSRRFFGPESIVTFEFNGKSQSLHWNTNNPNKAEHRGDLSPNVFIFAANTSNEKGANGIAGMGKSTDRLTAGSAKDLAELNSLLREANHSGLTAKKYVDQDDPFNQDNGRLVYESDRGYVEPSMIADGLTALINIRKSLRSWAKNFTDSANIIIIEEPEISLHPNLQKEIPIIFNELFLSLAPEIARKTFLLISTHSPFIISSSAKFKEQKVFPLQNGSPINFNFNDQSWVETNVSSGYSGANCAYVVSKMLGAEVTDFGYPENYCILEEYSLQIILDDARKKGIIKNIQFVSASGTSRSVDLAETIYELEKLNTLVKCNPYYFDKYLFVIDSVKNINDERLKKRLLEIRSRLGSRFIELKLHSLEDYYPNLDGNLEASAKSEISENERKNKGGSKAKYAKLISEKITDEQDFSRLFNGELDALLKSN
ncbi:AAA family ATPase [Leptolyngbya sp. GB1-A1]|uniref:AAA family ATPase n=1 Tax=Leptolyngbya sp. GB1-A1 TaxID=2933908 RepID=UPI003298E325